MKEKSKVNDENTDDENIFLEKLVENGTYIIGVDKANRVRISIDSNDYDKIKEINKIVLEINNLPMDRDDRNEYKMDIANIYQIAFMEENHAAEKYAQNLKNIIEKNLLIKRKKAFIKPTIIYFFIIIIIMNIVNFICSISIHYPLIYNALIYGSVGGLISVIINNNDFEIDYNVHEEYLKFESIKLVILSNTMSLMGNIAIKSKLVLGNLQFDNNCYLVYLILIICGYSQTFIPSLLKNLENEKLSK